LPHPAGAPFALSICHCRFSLIPAARTRFVRGREGFYWMRTRPSSRGKGSMPTSSRPAVSLPRRHVLGGIAAATLIGLPLGARAQAGAITIIVPYAPGAIDREIRALAPLLATALGQSVVVENRAGGGGAIGGQAVASAKPDGATLLYSAPAIVTALPLMRDLPYGFADVTPIARLTSAPHVLAVRADAPFRTLAEMLAFGRANPERIVFASSGAGTAVHLAGEAMARAAGIKINHVPFQGLTPAITAALGGTADIVVGLPTAIMPQVEAGKMRALAQFGDTRSPLVPDLPTLREQGVDVSLAVDIGLMGPKGMPQAAVDRLSQAMATAAAMPQFTEYAKTAQIAPAYLPPEPYRKVLEQDLAIHRELVAALGLSKK